MKALMQANKHSTVRELATALTVSFGSVHGHFKLLGFVTKLDVYGYRMSWKKFIWRIAWASAINSSNAKKTIRLKHMITGDEKWIVYNNVSRKKSQSRWGEVPERHAKAEIHQKKIMLSMWWNWKRLVFYELFPKNKTINSDVYCEQLQKLSDVHRNVPS